jgi:hypothetical protein
LKINPEEPPLPSICVLSAGKARRTRKAGCGLEKSLLRWNPIFPEKKKLQEFI